MLSAPQKRQKYGLIPMTLQLMIISICQSLLRLYFLNYVCFRAKVFVIQLFFVILPLLSARCGKDVICG